MTKTMDIAVAHFDRLLVSTSAFSTSQFSGFSVPDTRGLPIAQTIGSALQGLLPYWPLLMLTLGVVLALSARSRRVSGGALMVLGAILLPLEMGYAHVRATGLWPYAVAAERFWDLLSLYVALSLPAFAHWLKLSVLAVASASLLLVIVRKWEKVRGASAAASGGNHDR